MKLKQHPLQQLTSQTERAQNELGAVEDGEAGVLAVFVFSVFEAFKILGVSPRTNLPDLQQVH